VIVDNPYKTPYLLRDVSTSLIESKIMKTTMNIPNNAYSEIPNVNNDKTTISIMKAENSIQNPRQFTRSLIKATIVA